MGVRNAKREELGRLESKTLDAQFRTVIQDGLSRSPFEAEAVIEAVKEIYGPYLNGSNDPLPPGTMRLVVVDADEPAGKPVSDCRKRTIRLTVHRGAEDDRCLQRDGAEAFRRSRIPDLCQEALSQGALLTREDLAYRTFFVSRRTISRDLQALRNADPTTPIPLRSTVHDIGPVLTHRVQIVRLALEGKTMTQICQIMRHSPAAVTHKRIICRKRYAEGKSPELVAQETYHSLEAVDRCLGQFDRVRHCRKQDLSVEEIAFTLNCSRALVNEYLAIDQELEAGRDG